MIYLDDLLVGHVYLACTQNISMGFPTKSAALAHHWPVPFSCYFSFLSTTWFTEPLLTGVPSNPLITVYWQEVTAWISRNAGQFGILFGVVLSRFFHVPGSLFIWTFHVQRNERQTVGFKDVYWIHYYHLPNIIFLCSSVHYLYPSTFSLGRFVSS